MSKRQIVVLVSRAIALIEIIYALFDLTYLPERCVWLAYRLKWHSVLEARPLTSEPEFYSLIFSIVRLVIISGAAIVFWRCGQTVSNWLLPEEPARPERVS
jgi:hypothetical protein